MVQELLRQLREATTLEAAAFFLVVNSLVFCSSVGGCWLLGRMFPKRRLFDRWEPLRRIELAAALGSIVLNAVVSVFGWMLWTSVWIDLRPGSLTGGLRDCLIMILCMDFGMYLLHRAAHVPIIFKLVHRFHHRHEATNPISLFVLHPAEVLGFGGLMIAFLCVYPMTLGGLVAFLALNVLFGTLGHSGVEPFPRTLKSVPVLRLLGTSTFHAEHHEHPRYNFGFYTLLWDKLFGTLDPEYTERFDGAG